MVSSSRAKAAEHAMQYTNTPCAPEPVCFDYYGEDVFNEAAIAAHLPKNVGKRLLATMRGECPFDPSIAPQVAGAMKEWALSRGATHFTHWFQPLTGGTAEKHDSFLETDPVHNTAIMAFSGKNLIMGEPDASSFPSGGLRSTFEARGYTAWDPTSPAFIRRHGNGATLCSPTVFCSYTGEVLDRKTPALRSIQALSRSVSRLMKCFGFGQERTMITLGAEQEYFLVDRSYYMQRPDLIQTGRTLFGAPPPRHQQLEDHYFGAIKPRIVDFMHEVEIQLWKLGIPAKTRHNEVAPAQFELAPIFEELNLAQDHNMLVMQVLREVAKRHGMECLLHEKPYAGVNGSGKHNNWSLCYGKRNLLDPGDTPQDNAVFLTVLAAVLRAVNLHGDILRAMTASASNDHRLGANEAPPAIISIFLGAELNAIINSIIDGKGGCGTKGSREMRIGVDALPTLPQDSTDRNRTSPFAFTGNKFEFRTVGSSQSCSNVNAVINTIVAESMDYISDVLEKLTPAKFNSGLQKLIRQIFTDNRRIIFNGDGYTEEWQEEAKRRGLPNLRNTPEAIAPMLEKRNQELFAKYGVFIGKELASRHQVFMEAYRRKVRIEGELALEMATGMFLPVAAEEYGRLAAIYRDVSALAGTSSAFRKGPAALQSNLAALGEKYQQLEEARQNLKKALNGKSEERILNAMADLRKVVDALELIVDDERWPLPKYREMLFIY